MQISRNLLYDYTGGDSRLGRVAALNWNLNHVDEIMQIVHSIDHGVINNVDDLLARLCDVPIQNYAGSLAKRISFIRLMIAESRQSRDNLELSDCKNCEYEIIEI